MIATYSNNIKVYLNFNPAQFYLPNPCMKMEFIMKMTLQSLGIWMGRWTRYFPSSKSLTILWPEFSVRWRPDIIRCHLWFISKPPEKMSSSLLFANPNKPGHLIGGTAFEWCNHIPIKRSGWCFSLTMTHKHQKALIGPHHIPSIYQENEVWS